MKAKLVSGCLGLLSDNGKPHYRNYRVRSQAEKGIPAPTLVGGGRQEGPDVGHKEPKKVVAHSPITFKWVAGARGEVPVTRKEEDDVIS